MGLDQNDAVIRQRMRLKLEFLLEDLATEAASDDEQLTQFMQRLDAGQHRSITSSHPRYFANSRQPEMDNLGCDVGFEKYCDRHKKGQIRGYDVSRYLAQGYNRRAHVTLIRKT
jgi:hypothetical protein